jgi:DNA-binding MarR family transcriptional regulator
VADAGAPLPFGFETPEDSHGFLLWQTTTLWQQAVRQALAPSGTSHTRFVIMATLLWLSARQTAVTQAQIATLTRIDRMTVSVAVRNLISSGDLVRTPHPRDTRAHHLALTPQGERKIRNLVPRVETVDQQFFSTLEPGDQKALAQLLGRLNARHGTGVKAV